MPISIKEDLLLANPIIWTPTGYSITRKFQITGLAEYSPTLRPIMAVGATDSITGFIIPAIGTPHPDRPDAVVRQVQAVCHGNDCFDALCRYEWELLPTNYLKSFSGNLEQNHHHYDINDALATVTYTPAGGSPQTQVAELMPLRLRATLSFHFLQMLDPEASTLAYAGCVNSATWRGFGPRTWLCLPIDGSTIDGVWYRNVYRFAYNPNTWDQYVVFKNVDGAIPPDIAATIVTDGSVMSGNGWARFELYPSTDFNAAFTFIT